MIMSIDAEKADDNNLTAISVKGKISSANQEQKEDSLFGKEYLQKQKQKQKPTGNIIFNDESLSAFSLSKWDKAKMFTLTISIPYYTSQERR